MPFASSGFGLNYQILEISRLVDDLPAFGAIRKGGAMPFMLRTVEQWALACKDTLRLARGLKGLKTSTTFLR